MSGNKVRIVLAVVLSAAGFAIAGVAGAQDESNEASAEQAFQLLFERNIFDPDRRAQVSEAPEIYDEPVVEAPEPTDYIRLVGILIMDDTEMAFLEGTRPEYVTALFLDEYVDNLMLIEVDTEHAVFYCDNREIVLPVGAALGRQGQEAWHVTEATVPSSASADAGQDAGEVNTDDQENNAADSLLERLRKRREQELGNG